MATDTNGDKNIGFYRFGMEAEIELNANIKKLQLGCGGVNGANGCDIDNFSLSGLVDQNDRDARAGSSAKLTNPFIEFAIKNPQTASTREVVGFRLSAEMVEGLLSTGTANTNTPNGINSISGYLHVQSKSDANTITGTLTTAPQYLDGKWFFDNSTAKTGQRYTDGSEIKPIQGTLNAELLGTGLVTAGFQVSDGGFWIPGVKDVKFSAQGNTIRGKRYDGTLLPATSDGTLIGNRITGLNLVTDWVNLPNAVLGWTTDDTTCGTAANSKCNNYGTPNGTVFPAGSNYQNATDPYLRTQGGNVKAYVTSCDPSWICAIAGGVSGGSIVRRTLDTVHMYGFISGLKAQVNFNQSLGMIHALEIKSPLSLSLQGQNLKWPGSKPDDIAQKGWWMSISDPVYLGDLKPENDVSICGGAGNIDMAYCAMPQFVQQANVYFSNSANNPKSGDLISILSNGTLAVPISKPNQYGNGQGVALDGFKLTIDNLQLATQHFKPNCYGGLTFC